MNRHIVALASACSLWLCGQTQLPAQPEPTEGLYSFVFTVPSKEPVMMKINGENPKPRGFECGFVTSGLLTSLGSKTIEVSCAGWTAKPTAIQVTPAVSPIILIGLDETPGSSTTPPKKFLRISSARNLPPSEGWNYQIVYLSPNPEVSLTIDGARQTLVKWKPVKLKTKAGSVHLATASGSIAHLNPAEPGNYLIVLYEDPAGKPAARLVAEGVFSR